MIQNHQVPERVVPAGHPHDSESRGEHRRPRFPDEIDPRMSVGARFETTRHPTFHRGNRGHLRQENFVALPALATARPFSDDELTRELDAGPTADARFELLHPRELGFEVVNAPHAHLEFRVLLAELHGLA